MGIGMLVYMIFGIVESVTEISVLYFGGIIGLAYVSWAIGQFFDKTKKVNYLKGLLSYLLGMITFIFVATILGVGIDLIQKM
jgi:predicted tellurium resistance membrane protein TerC